MDTFIETPRFDDRISYGSGGGAEFKTFVFESDSGIEGRVAGWDTVRSKWNLAKNLRDNSDMQTVRAFFYNAIGKARGFRFKDHSDYVGTDQALGIGDGVTTVFKLRKLYTDGLNTYTKRIFKPVVGTTVVKKDGVTTGFVTINTTIGTVTFLTAPTLGQVLTASFEFDVPVRFDTDELMITQELHDLQSWASIPIVEILLTDV